MRKTKIALVMLLWGILVGVLMLRISKNIPYAYIHNDFYVYYIAAKLIVRGEPIYGVTEAFKDIKSENNLYFHWSTGYVYPPFTAFVFSPLTLLPPQLSAWVWFGFNITIFGLWIHRITLKWPSRWGLIYILTFPPAMYSLTSGQVNFILLWFLSWYILESKNVKSNLGLGLAILMKVFPGLFLLGEMVAHHRRSVLSTGLVMLVGFLLPIIFGKLDSTTDYFLRVLPGLQADRDGYFIHQSASAVLLRLTSSQDKIGTVLPETWVKYLTFSTFCLMIGGLVIWTVKRGTFRLEEKLVWLNGISLVAGRMTYWNFLPTALGSMYLLHHEKKLSGVQHHWLWFSIILSNLAWQKTYWFYQTLSVDTWWQRIVFGITTSVGFISVLIQLLILLLFIRKNGSK